MSKTQTQTKTEQSTASTKIRIEHVPVRNPAVRYEHIDPDIVKDVLAHAGLPDGLIPIVEVARGRYWPFDDDRYVLLLQQSHPDLIVAVDVLMTYESSATQKEVMQ